MLDTDAIRKDFPLLQQDWEPRPPLVYLDNGCMSLKPRQVIDAVLEYYERHSACSGRSVHYLASQVTRRIERSRQSIARFIGARRPEEVVLLRNTTEALNLVANGLAQFERVTDRLIALHLHDNDGAGDQHRIPFTGTIDWDRLAPLIAATGYDKPCMTLEIVIANTGIEDEAEFLRQSRAAGERFATLVATARE